LRPLQHILSIRVFEIFTRRIERTLMAILVTGGAGYIGSVTVEYLRSHGEDVVVLDDLSRGHRAAVDGSIPFYDGSIGDTSLLEKIARENSIESCIHFAAFAYVGESVTEPARYFENNVQKAISLVNGIVAAGIRRFVFSSTCSTYGEVEHIPINEQSRQWPTNPYGWSKLFVERLLASYDRAYGLKFVALRYFNAAGATATRGEDHDPEPHLIPNVLAAALGEQPDVPIFGDSYPTPDGTAVRDYIHVSDLAAGHVRALAYLRGGGASDFFNLGTGRGLSVLEVVDAARQVTGRTIVTRMEPRRPGDPSQLVADPSKARAVLGWEPAESDIHSIMRSAWAWRIAHPRGYADS
jgi:UDP-glucose 4-epimerase